jgi:uncharacterized membrane protein
MLILIVARMAASNAYAKNPHFTSIDYPGSGFSFANDINENGDVVGVYRMPNGSGGLLAPRGYLLSGGEFTSISCQGATRTRAMGINDNGDIVGDILVAGVNKGFVLRAGSSTCIPIQYEDGSFTPFYTDAGDINNTGDVTGEFDLPDGTTKSYVWNNGSFIRTLEANFPNTVVTMTHGINDSGELTGCYWLSDDSMHSLRVLADGTYSSEDFPGSMTSMHYRISNSSLAVGWYMDMAHSVHGYLVKKGEYESFDFPDALRTEAHGIAESNGLDSYMGLFGSKQLLIVGSYIDSAGKTHGFLFNRKIGIGSSGGGPISNEGSLRLSK